MWDDAILCQVKPGVGGECLFPGFRRVELGAGFHGCLDRRMIEWYCVWWCLVACLFTCLFICLVAGQLGSESVIYLCSITLCFNGRLID